jgi:hypothetical protein
MDFPLRTFFWYVRVFFCKEVFRVQAISAALPPKKTASKKAQIIFLNYFKIFANIG